MAYVLVLMYRHFQTSDDWLDMAQYLENMVAIGSEVKGGEWSKLRYWNLIVERPPEKRTVLDTKPPVKTKGMYRITDAGKRFVLCTLKVPRSVWVYNNKVLEVSKKNVTIRECLGKEFKYEDLMAGKLGSFVV